MMRVVGFGYLIAVPVLAVVWLATGHAEPLLGAGIGACLFVPFCYWLQAQR